MPKKEWTFITSHGAVLAYIASHDQVRGIDIALGLGLTERSVRRIIADLEAEGYITKERVSWFNRYKLNKKRPLRRAEIGDVEIGELLKVLLSDQKKKTKH
jgi:predicted ArsR family transcriptional regulator